MVLMVPVLGGTTVLRAMSASRCYGAGMSVRPRTQRPPIDLAVELGFESLWVVEHHFSEYLISPDPLQLLTWFGARHAHVGLGAGVVVLPWHHPIRCAEQPTHRLFGIVLALHSLPAVRAGWQYPAPCRIHSIEPAGVRAGS